ncbi:WhiB family transcriptional regulator [Phytoactinopolyspora mesophila]|uniref:Transcriptional regulator WhiB n=1 Tax=Phytoactinopolyspora mesophila TaxID=2650750 RepID=A0A7K3M9T7_9ACTN|nr:WhiB family transcriptional regulator [Phytoactinopolyspora mesophila]NDL60059.1 WhiB family transcriptional regulator [Phytoactinopolyspora mesophila]
MTALIDITEVHAEDWFGQQESWRALAACRGMDTDLFYPEGRGSTLRKREEFAKDICATCPVSSQCREAAARQPERFGIWGGLTEGDRGWSRR